MSKTGITKNEIYVILQSNYPMRLTKYRFFEKIKNSCLIMTSVIKFFHVDNEALSFTIDNKNFKQRGKVK